MQRWSRIIVHHPFWVLAAGFVILLASVFYGLSVFSRLSNGGYGDPNSSSWRAHELLQERFAEQRADIIVLFSADDVIATNTKYQVKIQEELADIDEVAGVSHVTSYFSSGAQNLISKDGRKTFALVAVDGDEATQEKVYQAITERLQDGEGVRIELGGNLAINDQISTQINRDLETAEMLSFPILAVLLLIVFRSVVSALVPLVLGGLSILVAFLLVRLLTTVTDVSVFAINIITLMGLGLAIDYSLFMVSRFREELAGGAEVDAGLATTLRTAGRTVLFSALTVILCLLGLLVFRQGFLRSMGLGGTAAVAATAILALTVLPAGLRLLGRRINALALPGLHRRFARPSHHGFWYRYSHFVMRRPLLTLAIALELLVVLGLPFLGARFSAPDVTTVPEGYSSRMVDQQLKAQFVGAGDSTVQLVVQTAGPATDPVNQQKLEQYVGKLKDLDGVWTTRITGTNGQYVSVQLTEAYESQSRSAQQTVRDIRTVALPTGWRAYSGGATAELVDLLDGLQERLPWAGMVIVLSTSLLLFLMLGSVVIPLKAVILNVLSLSAAFGLLVWVFQDGNLAGWFGLVSNGTLDATQPILIFAIAFGLAMDYELFLLSRVKEEFDRTGDNTHAVAHGVERTAGIISSAALMLVVVIGLFATGKIGIIQQVGVGLAAAVAIDASLVRMVLVPSAMRLMGDWNWWAPATLKRLSARLGLSEG